jgi:tetratricopeptide (TPR) repeat protein
MLALRAPSRLRLSMAMLLPLIYVYLFQIVSAPVAFGQAVSELPRTDYYLARELLRVGRTIDAADGFKVALNRARRIGEQRWVDSIPPLVMLGECYYQQGSLALALEQYDAALMLALTHAGWIDQIELQPEQLPDLDFASRGINWLAKSRPTRAVAVPEGLQISVDPTQAQAGPSGVPVAPVSLVTRLDVAEVMRAMGIALMRRWQLLGPLAKYSPLGGPLDTLFGRQPVQQAPWVTASWRVLQGLSRLSSPSGLDATDLLRQGTLIGNQLDYYLSPLTLLVQGQLEAREGSYQAAIVTLQDAAVLAAQFEQYDTLSEAVHWLSACASASQRVDLIDPLQRLGVWSNKKTGAVQVAALNGAAELYVYSGNLSQADKLLKQSANTLRGFEMALPRAQSQRLYVSALVAFGQEQQGAGVSNLGNALRLMRGTAATGAVIESIFQTQMTLDLLASGALTTANAEGLLQKTLAEPSTADWELTPLRTIATLTTSRLPAFERMLELAIAQNAEPEVVLARIDRLQRQRFFEALPLGGRLFAWRNAIGSDPQLLGVDDRQVVEASIQRFPALANSFQQIELLVEQLRQLPLPLDERTVGADAKRTFAELDGLSSSLENQLAFQSLLRRGLSRFTPPVVSLERSQQVLGDGDLVLCLVPTTQRIFGLAITRDNVRIWQVPDVDLVNSSLAALLVEIGLVRQKTVYLPSQVTDPDAAWHLSAANLLTALFPPEILDMHAQSTRVILNPTGWLWYVPFETLPNSPQPGDLPWIADRRLTYIPTIGSVDSAFGKQPQVKDTVGIVGSFFSLDREANEEQAQATLQAAPDSHAIFTTQKIMVPSAKWLKLRTDQLWVANELDNAGNGWNATVLPLGKARQAQIGSWLETPRHSPLRVLLPGLQTGMQAGQLQDGNEIFLPACGLLFSGTQSALLSRWSAGGTSTATIMRRYLQELQDESPSASLRRSVLAQWTEQFLIADEPVLLPAGKESAALTSGTHPLLWSGYMVIGDYSTQP